MQLGTRDGAYDDLGQLLKKLRLSCGPRLGPGEQVQYIVDRKIGLDLDKIPDVSWAGARKVKICTNLHQACCLCRGPMTLLATHVLQPLYKQIDIHTFNPSYSIPAFMSVCRSLPGRPVFIHRE